MDVNSVNQNITEFNGSILRAGLNFKKANLEVSHDILICGQFDGNIVSTAKVVLEAGSNVKGNIKCKNFECSGLFDGSLNVDDLAIFHSTSIVNGKVNVGHFSAEDGATFTSEIKVNRKPAAVNPIKK